MFYYIVNLLTAAKIREQFHEVTANDSYKINCDVSGGDRVVWRKNDKELILTNQQIYSGGNLNDPSLKFRKTSHLDRGNYSCETTYRSVTAKSTTIHLRVKGSHIFNIFKVNRFHVETKSK